MRSLILLPVVTWTALTLAAQGCKRPPKAGGDAGTGGETGPGDEGGGGSDSGDTGPVDADRDGHSPPEDCDDADPEVHPGAEERCDDGVDQDCDGTAAGCRPEGTRVRDDLDLLWQGAEAGGELGQALCAADLDGDGRDEVLLGAPFAQEERGRLYLGAESGGTVAEARVQLTGGSPGDHAARALACLGDLDGDGFDEVLVGMRGHDGGAEDAGAVVLLHGPLADGSADLADVGQLFASERPGELAGAGVAGGTDLTGDGLPDVIVGAPLSDRGGVESGAILLLAGPLSSTASPAVSLVEPRAVLHADVAASYVGFALDTAGDVDGDGVGDVVLGGWGNASAGAFSGAAWLVLGPLSGELPLADAERRWRGPADWALLGYAVSAAGDLDGDGLDDVLLGAPGVHGVENSEGRVYVLTDPVGTALDEARATLDGPGASAQAGFSLDGELDLDGDGWLDVLVGTPGHSELANSAGGAALAYGPLSGRLDLAEAPLRVLETQAGATAGAAVRRGGDLDGDGLGDLLLAVPLAEHDGAEASGVVGALLGSGW